MIWPPQKKLPSIVVIEGFWGVGKSTLITNIRQSYPVLFIPEPNYISAGIKTGISEWYQGQHNKRMKLAKKYIKFGENVILERSILSSAAFYYARHGFIPKWFDSSKLELSSLNNIHIFFLYNDKNSFLKNYSEIKDKGVKSAMAKESFYDNYFNFLAKIVPKLINQKIVCVKISGNRYQPDVNKEIKKILSDNHSWKRKIKEIKHYCASAIMFNGDKFLLLYSSKHGHFSLPQGHRNKGEEFASTISREIKEETGFYDFEIIMPIDTYGFRFYNKNQIIHKIITCFLVRLNSLKKNKKCFEVHESYTNRFFTAENAIKKLKWSEDKEIMKRAQNIIMANKKMPHFKKRGILSFKSSATTIDLKSLVRNNSFERVYQQS